jgi:hypothetical protein
LASLRFEMPSSSADSHCQLEMVWGIFHADNKEYWEMKGQMERDSFLVLSEIRVQLIKVLAPSSLWIFATSRKSRSITVLYFELLATCQRLKRDNFSLVHL